MRLWILFESMETFGNICFISQTTQLNSGHKFQTAFCSFDVYPIFKALHYYLDQSYICTIQWSFWDLGINLSHSSALKAYEMLVSIKSIPVQLMGPEVHKHFHRAPFSSFSLSAISTMHSSSLKLPFSVIWQRTGALFVHPAKYFS